MFVSVAVRVTGSFGEGNNGLIQLQEKIASVRLYFYAQEHSTKEESHQTCCPVTAVRNELLKLDSYDFTTAVDDVFYDVTPLTVK